jgi:hypothetical protein
MGTQIALSAGTAVFSSLLTLALVYLLWSRRLRPRLEKRMEAMVEAFGDALRQQVRDGVVDGLQSISAKEVLTGTRKAISRTAEQVVKGGLVSLFSDKDD